MEKQIGKTIKEFIWEQNISLEDREYMSNISEDDLVVYRTTSEESVVVLRKLANNEYELLLQVGINTDTLILRLLRQEEIVLYNFRAIGEKQLRLIGEIAKDDNKKDDDFIGVNDCYDIYHLSEFSPNHRLVTYRVGVYEVSN